MEANTNDHFIHRTHLFLKTIHRGFRQHDPAYFGQVLDLTLRESRDLAMLVIGKFADDVCRVFPDASTTAALWKMRGMVAPFAQTLHKAAAGLHARIVSFRREADAPGLANALMVADGEMYASIQAPQRNIDCTTSPDIEQCFASNVYGPNADDKGKAIEARVLEWVLKEPEQAMAGNAPLRFQEMIETIVTQEASGLPPGFEELTLIKSVRRKLVGTALFLQRASACLWMMALDKQSERPGKSFDRADTVVTIPKYKAATSDDAASYLRALKTFAGEIASLNIDPASLPIGEDAVDEALALCEVRHFMQRRYSELRRWVHPQAAVDSDCATDDERGADRGDRLILAFTGDDPASADATDPRAWTWQDQESADYAIADLLTSLHQAADALGVDWDASRRKDERQHACEGKASELRLEF